MKYRNMKVLILENLWNRLERKMLKKETKQPNGMIIQHVQHKRTSRLGKLRANPPRECLVVCFQVNFENLGSLKLVYFICLDHFALKYPCKVFVNFGNQRSACYSYCVVRRPFIHHNLMRPRIGILTPL